ncbi:MAG: response regulator, partial [Acidobacteriota bacterium]
TGMGLASVYGIIKQHHGLIRVASAPGQGATFRVLLPISQQPATATRVRVEAPLLGGKETVLVAEDEAEVRHILVEVLGGLGYKVLEAVDGLAALELLRHERVDLVLTDVVMPRMGGWELREAALNVAPDAL